MNRDNFETIGERNPYPTRRQNDLTIPMVTTELCRRSFKNAGIRDWNALPDSIRENEEKAEFKRKLRTKHNPDPYYSIEDTRKGAMLLCRLRCGNPDLNYNLFTRNLSVTPNCECGSAYETTEHCITKPDKMGRTYYQPTLGTQETYCMDLEYAMTKKPTF